MEENYNLDVGIFNDFWDGKPNHIPLMGLHENKDTLVIQSFEILDHICDTIDEKIIYDDIHKLIKQGSHRTYIVAILASFKISNDLQQHLIENFWDIASEGSKVTGQILSVLSIIDKDFESEIQNRYALANKVFREHIQHYLSSKDRVIPNKP